LLFAGVAVTEELLFRGFVFQRLISGLGVWPAQFIIAAFFLPTHWSNPGMIGSTKLVASNKYISCLDPIWRGFSPDEESGFASRAALDG
jgi:membrane protease YdiL (CAAX protease family)